MRGKLGALFMGLGVLLTVAAAAWTGYNALEEWRGGKASAYILGQIKSIMQQEEHLQGVVPEAEQKGTGNAVIEERFEEDAEGDAEETSPWAPEMPTIGIDQKEYIGYLSIPKLELALPVMGRWDYPSLKIAPCRQYGSPQEGKFVIAGHNYDGHFGRIHLLERGDAIFFTDVTGAQYAYRVQLIEIFNPQDVEEVRDSDWALTLYTCTAGGKQRVVLRAEEDSAEKTFLKEP